MLSIVINNYNYAQFLPDAIDSALGQTVGVDVVVVDDCSTDDSRKIIESYGDQITAIFNEQNLGQSLTCSKGFTKAKGDLIIFLDSDDELLPYAAEVAIATMASGDSVKAHWEPLSIDQYGVRHKKRYRYLSATDAIAPTSCNVWRKSFLEKVLPFEGFKDHHGFDLYLHHQAKGDAFCIKKHLSFYRIHEDNYRNSSNPDKKRLKANDNARIKTLSV